MANNRMLLRCKNCKEVYMIGKYYPVSWAWPIDSEDFSKWLDKHDDENAIAYEGDIATEAEFYDLVYENSCDDIKWRKLKDNLNG